MSLCLANEDSRIIVSLQKINYGNLERERHRSYLGSEPITFSSCHTGVKGRDRDSLFAEDLIETAELESQVRESILVRKEATLMRVLYD